MFIETKYHGIYRDDGFIVFEGIKKKKEMNNWLEIFQWRVDKIAESECLQFTMEVWGEDDDPSIINEKLIFVNEKYLTYLDMEMYWNDNNDLNFQVHLKPNQVLKYLNSDSTHLPSVFKAIPSGVLERVGKLTSKSKKLMKTKINKIYHLHCQDL